MPIIAPDEKKFRFWMPIDKLEKGTDKDGNEVMIVGGIASTSRLDMDYESLNATREGLDVSYLKERGIVNWNHSKAPEAVIGEPTKIEFKPEGMYVESMLYPDSELAKKVYALGKTFKKNSRTRRLGYSIEGGVIARNPNNPSSVQKARITGLALTVNPKNADSLVDILKGNFHDYSDDDASVQAQVLDISSLANGGTTKLLIDITQPDGTRICVDKEYNIKIYKDLNTQSDSGKAVMHESVDGALKTRDYKTRLQNLKKRRGDDECLTKGEVYDKIFDRYGVISLQTVNKIFDKINPTIMKGNNPDQITGVTDDMLEKALNQLEGTALNKGFDNANGDTADFKKGDDADKEKEKDEDGKDAEPAKGKDEEKVEKGLGAEPAVIPSVFDSLQKSIDAMNQNFPAIGVLLKGMNDKLNTVITENSELKTELSELKKGLDETPYIPQRRTVAKAGAQRQFEAGQEQNIEKGLGAENIISVSKNKKAVVGLLDEMAFNKGFDATMAKALTTFESSSFLEPAIAQRIKTERGITIVN